MTWGGPGARIRTPLLLLGWALLGPASACGWVDGGAEEGESARRTVGTTKEVEDGAIFVRVEAGAPVSDAGPSRGVAWGDADGDGLPDLAVANSGGWPQWLFRNLGGGSFEHVVDGWPVSTGGWTQGVSWVDYDGDGDLDLHLTDWGTRGHPLRSGPEYRPTSLFRNEGSGRGPLVELTPVAAGGLTDDALPAVQACWSDLDRDGDLDAFLVVRDGADDVLYENRGDGSFRRLRRGPWIGRGREGRTCGTGDADGDGLPEIYVGNFAGEDDALYRNLGGLRFREVRAGPLVESGGRTYGISWVDYDDDGDLDLYVANGTMGTEDVPDFGVENFLYLSRGDGSFRRVEAGPAATDARVSAGAAWADFDRDGDLDLYVANWGGGGEQRTNDLYRNTTSERTGRHWVTFHLEGTESNRTGIGAEVRLVARIGGRLRRQARRLLPGTGFASRNEPIVHFGLGDAAVVDSVIVAWPSGAVDRFHDLDANAVFRVREGGEIRRAEANRRSMKQEAIRILEDALGERAGPPSPDEVDALRVRGSAPLTDELLREARSVGRP